MVDHAESLAFSVFRMMDGHTAVMIGGSHPPMDRNIELTESVCDVAHEISVVHGGSGIDAETVTAASMLGQGHGSECHAAPDMHLGIGFDLASGSMVHWYRGTIGQARVVAEGGSADDAYNKLTEYAARSRPGANGIMVPAQICGAGTACSEREHGCA